MTKMISALTNLAIVSLVAATAAPTELELELAERLGESMREVDILAARIRAGEKPVGNDA